MKKVLIIILLILDLFGGYLLLDKFYLNPKSDNTLKRKKSGQDKYANFSFGELNESQQRQLAEGLKINVNKASAEELRTVHGIGPSTARNIIKYRDENGPFYTIDDLTKVTRIGKKTLEKFKDYVTVGDIKPPPGYLKNKNQGPVININTATKEQLQELTGVGPSTAESIIEYREANGVFYKPEDIMNVRGIGKQTYEKMADNITVGDVGPAPARKTRPSVSTSKSLTSQPSYRPATPSKININTANSMELEKIKGVGPSTAQKIIDYRKTHGGFKNTSDIMKVRGIGPATYNKMKEQITVR